MSRQFPLRLKRITSIGDWTARYIALRALRHPGAFPAGDVALQNATGKLAGRKPREAELRGRAGSRQPWRAYAAQHLWAGLASAAPAGNDSRTNKKKGKGCSAI